MPKYRFQRIFKILLAGLLFLNFKGITTAQEFSLKNYAVDDGVPSPEVYCAMQDTKGYMWFGTDRGVCKFNGYRFETFTTADGLCYNTVFQIHEDFNNRIWFISNSNQLCFYTNGTIQPHPANQLLKKLFPSTTFSSFYYDKGDTIWLAVNNYGLVKITPDNKIINVVNAEQQAIKFFSGGNILFSRSPSINLLWLQPGMKQRVTTFYGHNFHSPVFIKSVNNNFYLTNGLKNEKLTLFNSNGIKQTQNIGFQVISGITTANNELWLGSRSQGLYCYALNDLSTPKRRLLKNATVTSIMQDKEGNYWFTTLEDGIYLLRTLNVQSYSAIDGDDNNKYTATFTNGNYLWISTDKGFVYKVDQKNSFYRYKQLESSILSFTQGNSATGSIWAGSNTNVYEINNLNLNPLNTNKSVSRIHKGPGNKIWGAKNKTLFYYNTEWEVCEGAGQGENEFIDALAEDNNGVVWLACNDGLWKYDSKTAKYEKVQSIASRVNDIKITKNNTIWLATQGSGILILKDNNLKKIDKNNGLLSNLCNNIYIDDKQNVWVSTYFGLNCIKNINDDYSITAFSTNNGLISNEVLECIKFNNKLWVFTGNGISFFNPAEIKPDTFLPLVYITTFTINGTPRLITNDYKLTHEENNITIEFIGLYYKNTGRVNYRYKMEGIDAQWNYTKSTSVQYGVLQPGSYRFRVASQNNAGQWHESKNIITIKISPPYWKQLWFILLAIFFTIALLFLIINNRINNIIKRRNLINELDNYKNHALQARMNPHFIFNSLNSINNFILQNDKQNSSRYLSKFASLMRFILDNSTKKDIPLETELHGLGLYLELEKQRFKDKLNYNIKISPDISVVSVRIPALILQPFVENAIIHGIMPKVGPGNINVEIYKNNSTGIICAIEDDGIGRKKSMERKKANFHNHISNGIEVTRQRLQLMNKLHNENTTLNIIDITDINGNAKGTRVEIGLPFI